MRYFIGVDLGGTNVRSLLVDEKGTIIAEVKDVTESEKGPDYVTQKIIKQIESIDYTGIGGFEHVDGIGIGVPGPVDTVNKYMVMATNLHDFAKYPICDKLEAYFSKPTFIDNDANVAGLAEAIVGAGRLKATVFYITISTGIGGAFIVDGKLVSGNRGHAGEIGNIIVKSNGEKINHLNAGAVENEASGTAIVRKARKIFGEEAIKHAGNVFELAANGDKDAIAIKEDFLDCITTMMANIAHTVDPHCFVIGGGVMKSKDYFINELNEMFNSKIHEGMRGYTPIYSVEIDDCGAIGAAMLPMSQLQ